MEEMSGQLRKRKIIMWRIQDTIIYLCVCMCMCVHIYIYIYPCVCICVCVCVCIFMGVWNGFQVSKLGGAVLTMHVEWMCCMCVSSVSKMKAIPKIKNLRHCFFIITGSILYSSCLAKLMRLWVGVLVCYFDISRFLRAAKKVFFLQ